MTAHPSNLRKEFLNTNETSFKKYLATYQDFCNRSGYSDFNKPPSEEEIRNFLQLRRSEKCVGNTLWSYFSHLNSICQHFWNIKLQDEYKRVTTMLKNYTRGETVKKAEVLNKSHVDRFRAIVWRSGTKDCKLLVRGALMEVATSGGLRMDEVKK